MDGFEELAKTETWAALRRADDACFAIKAALHRDGLPDEGEQFQARVELCRLENRLRELCKRRARAHVERCADSGTDIEEEK